MFRKGTSMEIESGLVAEGRLTINGHDGSVEMEVFLN